MGNFTESKTLTFSIIIIEAEKGLFPLADVVKQYLVDADNRISTGYAFPIGSLIHIGEPNFIQKW